MQHANSRYFVAVATVVALGVPGAVRLFAQSAPTLIGGWRVSRGVEAPWVKPSDPRPNARVAIGDTLRFSTAAVGGSKLIRCRSPQFTATRVPANGLFQGNLPEPAVKNARDILGFTKLPVAGVRVGCDAGIFEFHQADAETMLVAIDNVIWTLTRASGALASAASPAGVVERFLETHFAGDMGFDKTSALSKRAFFTAELLQYMTTYFAQVKSADMVPSIDGDAFTDTQEYPKRFAVSTGTVTGETAMVPARFADGYQTHRGTYVLRKQNGVWRIDDVRYDGRLSLVNLLR